MSDPHVAGAYPPAADPVRTYQVLRVQKHGPLDVTLLADTVQGVGTHYVYLPKCGWYESRFCTQHDGNCEYHHLEWEWAGFMPVYCHQRLKPAVLRLAPREYDVVRAVLGIDLRWRHTRIELTPTNNGDGRRCRCEKAREGREPALWPAHQIERTIVVLMRGQRFPRQQPYTPGQDDEGRPYQWTTK